MSDTYFVSIENPNNLTGGGGCLATGRKQGEDCEGPWINFHRSSTEFNESPYSAICQKHLTEAADNWDREEALTGGDPPPVSDYKRETILDPSA